MLTILMYPILEPLVVMYFIVDGRRACLECVNPARSVTWKITPSTSSSQPNGSSSSSGGHPIVADSIEMSAI